MPRPNAKACLLSGPPGIGKSSAAKIACQELGFNVIETNASDCRNKLSINNSLKDLSTNQTLDYFEVFNPDLNKDLEQPNESKKSVIIVDEADGVGAGDRGGL